MSFIGPTTEKAITTNGRTYKIFLTEQAGGYWIGTVLYAINGIVTTHNELGSSKQDAYQRASDWTLDNIDKDADIEAL
jgi:hypothetical protein